jgi:hypothetical protein
MEEKAEEFLELKITFHEVRLKEFREKHFEMLKVSPSSFDAEVGETFFSFDEKKQKLSWHASENDIFIWPVGDMIKTPQDIVNGHLLGRAIKEKEVLVFEMMGGFGRDGLILHHQGHKLVTTERDLFIYLGLRLAHLWAKIFYEKKWQWDLHYGDGEKWLEKNQDISFDVIYLDPMYPEKKKSALPKKNLQLLQKLTESGGEQDVNELVTKCREYAIKKVILKRPHHAPLGSDIHYQLKSKLVRFDIFLPFAKKVLS